MAQGWFLDTHLPLGHPFMAIVTLAADIRTNEPVVLKRYRMGTGDEVFKRVNVTGTTFRSVNAKIIVTADLSVTTPLAASVTATMSVAAGLSSTTGFIAVNLIPRDYSDDYMAVDYHAGTRVDANLVRRRTFGADLTGSGQATGNLGATIPLAADITATALATADVGKLSTTKTLAAAVSASATVGADLVHLVQFSASMTGTATATAAEPVVHVTLLADVSTTASTPVSVKRALQPRPSPPGRS